MSASKTDKHYYVDFGPELLQLLGPNLYTNIYFVLGEIIANSYDADAKNVYILYNNKSNTIIIEDDGNGMSYEDVNDKFLPIGEPTRTTEEDSFTPNGRRKMGRKGIGKLAALSVSQQIRVLTMKDGDKSGCILSLDIKEKNDEGRYEIPAIPEEEIDFMIIDKNHNGSSIIMENSRYPVHKSIESAKKNISLIFPFASEEFRIHLYDIETNKDIIIDDSVCDIIKLSDTLITFCNEESEMNDTLSSLHKHFEDERYYKLLKEAIPETNLPKKKVLNKREKAFSKKLVLLNKQGEEKEYILLIEGWIATYFSTRGKNKDNDFPANHISIIANGKLGQFNILPDITTDRMTEAYVVGQFFVDLLEETELPDIAASNRQGYKEDDKRIIETRALIREKALLPALYLKDEATEEKNYIKNLKRQEKLRQAKEEAKKTVTEIIEDEVIKSGIKESEPFKRKLELALDLKNTLKDTYRKIMISHDSYDKDLVDQLERILLYCGFECKELIYTSSNNYDSKIPGAYTNIYEYLKEFFYNTVIKHDLCVIYILNGNFVTKWNPTLEAGAGWIVESTKFLLVTDSHNNILSPFEREPYVPYLKDSLNEEEVCYLASAVYQICNNCGKNDRTEEQIRHYIRTSTTLFNTM